MARGTVGRGSSLIGQSVGKENSILVVGMFTLMSPIVGLSEGCSDGYGEIVLAMGGAETDVGKDSMVGSADGGLTGVKISIIG